MEQEITSLPTIFAKGDLTLEHIGALFVLAAAPNLTKNENKYWNSKITEELLWDLQFRGVDVSYDETSVDVNFDNLVKGQKEFPRLQLSADEWDDNGNDIYSVTSLSSLDEACAYYKFEPVLKDNRVIYVYTGDDELLCYDDSLKAGDVFMVDSLEEAEEWVNRMERLIYISSLAEQ